MMRRARLPILTLAAALVSSALVAETYTITLKSGNSFTSRYQPQDASWDASKVIFMTDQGNEISISKAELVSVTTETENRGFGRSINSTTVELGWAPNDTVEGAQLNQGTSTEPVTFKQFIEPGETQGVPLLGATSPSYGPAVLPPGTIPQPAPPPGPATAPPPAPPPSSQNQ